MYQIQSDVPIPPVDTSNRGIGLKYPFDRMEPGQSFDVPVTGDDTPKQVAQRLRGAANNWAKRHEKPHRFTVRYVADKNVARIWRIDGTSN